MDRIQGTEVDESVGSRAAGTRPDDPTRPLPPPPTPAELVEVCWQRFRLRHPGWDATRLVLVVTAVIGLAGMTWAVLLSPAGSGRSVAVRDAVSTTVGVSPFASSSTGPSTTASPTTLVVDVAGAVAHPGPIRVSTRSRVVDAIRAAGGPSDDADLERVDRAAPLHDGERIYVPRRGQTDVPQVVGADGPGGGGGTTVGDGAASAANPGGTASVVNLNTAGAAALESLPGVGPATAQAIIDYRQSHGRFAAIDDLLDVKGIGPAKFAALKAHVSV